MIKTFITSLDNDKEFSEVLKFILEETGEPYQIEQFTTGREFMARLDIKEELDIAIIDVHVPDFNIIEAVQKIRYTIPHAYIIVVSGDEDAIIITKLVNVYEANYVLKGAQYFSEQLTSLVYKTHQKVQMRKVYLLDAIAAQGKGSVNGD